MATVQRELVLPLAGLAMLPPLRVALSDGARSRTLGFWGLELALFTAALLSLLAFAGWAAIGVYRLMRAELQVRNPPLAWLA